MLAFISASCTILRAQSSANIEQLTIKNGLSQGYVNCVLQDREGFIWMGTKNGLNRYDGHQVKVFSHNPFDSTSLSAEWVQSLHEYGDYLLVGMHGGGINIFSKKTHQATKLWAENDTAAFLAKSRVWKCGTDESGNLWLGAALSEKNRKLIKVSLKNGWFEKAGQNKMEVGFLVFDQIKFNSNDRFSIDRKGGAVWVNSSNRLAKINTGSGEIQFFSFPPQITPSKVTDIKVGQNGLVWVSCSNGIGQFDGSNWKYIPTYFLPKHIFPMPGDDHVFLRAVDLLEFRLSDFQEGELKPADAVSIIPISKGKILDLTKDRSGIIWMGTSGHGVIRQNPRRQRFKHSFPGYSINSFLIHLPDGNMGFYSKSRLHFARSLPPRFNPLTKVFNRQTDLGKYDGQNNFWLLSATVDKDSLVFSKTNREGVSKTILTIPSKLTTTGYFAIGENGDILLAQNGSFIKYDPSRKQTNTFDYRHVLPEEHSVADLIETTNGQWWIGTEKGLVRAVPNGEGFDFQLFNVIPNDETSIRQNNISCLVQDLANPNVLWIGTKGGGLNRLDINSLEFTHLATDSSLGPDGEKLPNNVIYGILVDEIGRFWMSSNKGIIRYNPVSGDLRNYTVEDGLPTNEFNSRAFAKSHDGTFYFGCVEGLISFDPAKFSDNPVPPEVRITGLEINNQSIFLGDATNVLSEAIEYTRQITLPFSQNSLSLTLSALEYSVPSKNKFRYYLKGAEPEWAHETTDKKAAYLNLSPGKYTFLVLGANSDGVWNKRPTSLKITILPPWYRTTLAYLVYALLFIASIYGVFRFFLYRERLRHELTLEQKEAERLKELDAFKSKLYTNVTHEFRTPLTVIQGMADQIEENPGKWLAKGLKMIRRNSTDLLNLVNQMLDLRKLESGLLTVNMVNGDVVDYVRYIIESFHSYAESNGLQFHFLSTREQLQMDYDPEKLLRIISNLLSNAVKYTPAGGHIYLQLDQQEGPMDGAATGPTGTLLIRVQDTGQGIPPEELPNIFDRYFQAEQSSSKAGSSGIGLSLVQELVKVLEGTIVVNSTIGRGTTFLIKLPIRQSSIKFPQTPEPQTSPSWSAPEPPFPIPLHSTNDNQQSAINAPSLLIVEDNPDVAQYVQACVQAHYKVTLAVDGEMGISQAIEQVPDIIISDVMMPVKDGFEVVDTLKNDERTSHIPIILLTAKIDDASRIKGLERGADAYLSKPFNKTELLVRLKKLLELRRKLQERYASGQLAASSGQPAVGSEQGKTRQPANEVYEDAFMQKLQKAVEDEMDDENFGIKELCLALGMSRTQLHNKIKALTGKSTTIYIRTLRLQKARELLLTSEMTVSEVAFEVGFRHLQYFSTSFSEEFGLPPSQVRS